MNTNPDLAEQVSYPALQTAVQGGDIAVLLAVLVQLTGDEGLLDECRPFIKGPWDFTVDVPPTLDEKIRRSLLEVLRSSSTCEVTIPSSALIERIMGAIVGEAVPVDYVKMLSQDLGFVKPASIQPDRIAQDFKVLVIGAGLSGICAAIRLKEAGYSFEVLEKNAEVGGTWYENVYPGCAVDTPNHFYSFSFELNHNWSRYFAKRDELYAYLKQTADKYEVLAGIVFETEVLSTIYDDQSGIWTVTSRGKDGTVTERQANAVFFAVGGLTRPAWPKLAGIDEFKGVKLHTAAWDSSVSLNGKRVALVGTGASAMQAGPAIANGVEQLTIYQRSPQWVSPNPNYHREVPEGKKLALKCIPFYARWFRFQLFWAGADMMHDSLIRDPDWPHPERSLNAKNDVMRVRLVEHIESELKGRPDLISKVVPNYPPYGKRMLRDNHWYATLRRENVELVAGKVERLTKTGVVADGVEREADVVIFATGFNTHESLAPIDIRGRGGRSIRDVWGKDDPRAYLGVTVPQFPNMFVLFGPNTVLAHGGSAVFHSEVQVTYAMQGLAALLNKNGKSLECRQDVHDAYNQRVDEAHSNMVWSHPGVDNWYRNAKGRVTMATPWRMVDYWKWLSTFDETAYIWT